MQIFEHANTAGAILSQTTTNVYTALIRGICVVSLKVTMLYKQTLLIHCC